MKRSYKIKFICEYEKLFKTDFPCRKYTHDVMADLLRGVWEMCNFTWIKI